MGDFSFDPTGGDNLGSLFDPSQIGGYGDTAAVGNVDVTPIVPGLNAPTGGYTIDDGSSIPSYLANGASGTLNTPDATSLPLNDPTSELTWMQGVSPGAGTTTDPTQYVSPDVSIPSGVATNPVAPVKQTFGSLIGSIFGNNPAGVAATRNSVLTNQSRLATPVQRQNAGTVTLPVFGAVSGTSAYVGIAIFAVLAFWVATRLRA